MRAFSRAMAFSSVILCGLAFIPATIPINAQTIWHVDDNAPDDPGPGDPAVSDPQEDGSAVHPFDAIQEGIDAALSGDSVQVAEGTYRGDGNRDLDFGGKAITLFSESGPLSCVIDCEAGPHPIYHRGFNFQSGEGNDSIVRGFTIKNGYIQAGGAVQCFNSSPTITGNVITGNFSFASYPGGGGGIYCENGSPVITENFIMENEADIGGGIYCYNASPVIDNNLLHLNKADSDGGGGIYCIGISSPMISNNLIRRNIVGTSSNWGDGGGIYCGWDTSATISRNVIESNIAAGDDYQGALAYGGGICCFSATATITSNIIRGNRVSTGFGAGLFCIGSPTVANNLIHGNTADVGWYSGDGGYGGGVCLFNSNTILLNNTIVGNTAEYGGGGIYCISDSKATLTDSILWNNSAPSGPEIQISSSSQLDADYSDVEGGQGLVVVDPGCILDWGAGMIEVDPLLVTGEGGDHYLSQFVAGQAADSPCLDAGSDLAGNICFTTAEGLVCLDQLTTRTDEAADLGPVDMGFHYHPLRVWFVDDDGPNDPGPGSPLVSDPLEDGTPAHPYDSIQEGIMAAHQGETVLVSPGTYTGPGNKNLDFGGRLITVQSESGPDSCVIDCESSGRGIYFHLGEDENAVVQGFTIRNGYIAGNDDGGGIKIEDASPTVRDNIITQNSSEDAGGGIYCYDHASPVIVNNQIIGNSADDGGGVYCRYFCSPTISGNTIKQNQALRGGGIFAREFSSSSSPTVTGNTIEGNTALDWGGGIYCWAIWYDAAPTVANNMINNNSAGNGGGGIFLSVPVDLVVSNNTITGNMAQEGGGIYCRNTICTLKDCILWSNIAPTGKEIYLGDTSQPSDLDINHSNVDGGMASVHADPASTILWGAGMIDAAPLFTSGPGGEFYLSQIAAGQALDSPCLDSGSGQAEDVCFPGAEGSQCLDQLTTRTDGVLDSMVADMGFHYHPMDGHSPTINAELVCHPASGTLSFKLGILVTLENLNPDQTRKVAARLDIRLGNGGFLGNWRAGHTNIAAGTSFSKSWSVQLPVLEELIGDNIFTLAAEDVTPTPYNQPPYPRAGDTSSADCTVTAVAP